MIIYQQLIRQKEDLGSYPPCILQSLPNLILQNFPSFKVTQLLVCYTKWRSQSEVVLLANFENKTKNDSNDSSSKAYFNFSLLCLCVCWGGKERGKECQWDKIYRTIPPCVSIMENHTIIHWTTIIVLLVLLCDYIYLCLQIFFFNFLLLQNII